MIEEKETFLDNDPGRSKRGKGSSSSMRNVGGKHHDEDVTQPQIKNVRGFKRGSKLSKSFGESGHSRYPLITHSDRHQRRMSERSQQESLYSDRWSESSSYYTREKKSDKWRGKATNIDEFDEKDWSDSRSDSESSYSSEYSDSSGSKHYQPRSSASVSDLPNATWALQGSEAQEGVVNETRIKAQENEIKLLLGNLREIQKQLNVKALPVVKQSILQRDMQNLEQLRRRQREMPGNVGVLTQLIGQQMLLSDHLKDAIDLVKVSGCGLCYSSALYLLAQCEYIVTITTHLLHVTHCPYVCTTYRFYS